MPENWKGLKSHMAWFHINFYSDCLQRLVQLKILLPPDLNRQRPQENFFRTIYLLHSSIDDYAGIEEISRQMNLAVVIPVCRHDFFVNMEDNGQMYSQFLGEELVAFTRKFFPLSRRREDTIIAGFSAGGFGALHNGLKYYDVFGHTIALSSALVIKGIVETATAGKEGGANQNYFEAIFGDLSLLPKSDKNPEVLAKTIIENSDYPLDFYLACGYNDLLVFENRKFSMYLKSIGFPHIYEEGPGSHDWLFWQRFLRKGLERLLLPKTERKYPFHVKITTASPDIT